MAGSRADLSALLEQRHRVAGSLLAGSGTEALILAFQLAEHLLGQAPEIVLPAFSCFDLAAASVYYGRPLSFYDLDPDTLGPDSESLERAIAQACGPAVVVVQSLFGLPPDWETLDPILSDSFVVEDAAQAHGALWQGRPLGGHGRLGVLSFGRGKGWTGGEGGALLIRDARDADDSSELALAPALDGGRVVFKALAHWGFGRPRLYGLPRSIPGLGLGDTHYREPPPPRAMASVSARLTLSSAEAADQWARQRQHAARAYLRAFTSSEYLGKEIAPVPDAAPGYLRFPVRLPRGMASFPRPRAALRLGAAPTYPKTLRDLAQVAHLLRSRDSEPFPGARELVETLVTLPTHPQVTDAERTRLIALLRA